MRFSLVIAVLATVVGCASPAPEPTAAPEPLFTMSLDGEPVDVSFVVGDGRVALSSLVSTPVERWTSVVVEGTRGSRVRVIKPAVEHAGYDLLLHPGDAGTLSFGVFRRLNEVPTGLRERYARPKVAVLDVTSVAVRTVEPTSEATPVPDRTLATIEGAARPVVLAQPTLYSLPEVDAPRSVAPGASKRAKKEGRARGRSLAAVLKALEVDAPHGVLVRSDRDGEVLIPAADLASGPGALLRVNRRGGLVVELLDPEGANRLRDVSTLVVRPAP